MLRQRLLRRGVTLSIAGLSAALAAHAIEAAPVVSLVRSPREWRCPSPIRRRQSPSRRA